jgi:hypothetical protein
MHHRFKHESGAEVIPLDAGVYLWRTPRGLQYVTAPDPPLLDDDLFTLVTGGVAGGRSRTGAFTPIEEPCARSDSQT